MAESDLGLAPWDVLHQGIQVHTGILMGTVGIGVGLLLLLAFPPLKEKIGLGTVLNILVIGVVIDAAMAVLSQPQQTPVRWAFLLGGIVLIAYGSGLYIGAGLGTGPRDGIMTGLARRGVNVGAVRAAIELVVLVGGWFLGGTVGVGTVAFAVLIGPMVAWFLPRLSIVDVLAATDGTVPPPGAPAIVQAPHGG